MNINHEYWHLRENDPSSNDPNAFSTNNSSGPSRLDIKFSFGNCLDDGNEVKTPPPFGYVPEVAFKNLSWMDHLAASRFPALAGWQKSFDEIFAVLNQVTFQIFSQFQINGQLARPEGEVWYGQGGKGFGWGTVHHAAGTLRMPYRPRLDGPFEFNSVVDQDLRLPEPSTSTSATCRSCHSVLRQTPYAPWPPWRFVSPSILAERCSGGWLPFKAVEARRVERENGVVRHLLLIGGATHAVTRVQVERGVAGH